MSNGCVCGCPGLKSRYRRKRRQALLGSNLPRACLLPTTTGRSPMRQWRIWLLPAHAGRSCVSSAELIGHRSMPQKSTHALETHRLFRPDSRSHAASDVDWLVPLVSRPKEQSHRGVSGPERNIRALSEDVSRALPFATCGEYGGRTPAQSGVSSHSDSDVIHGISDRRTKLEEKTCIPVA